MLRIFFSLVITLFLAGQSLAQESARSLQKLTNHVYAYAGIQNAYPSENSFGANSGVVIGENAVMVIDTLVSAKEAQKLLADIRKITDKPIKYVVNTHYHLDHAWGNNVFEELGAVIIAHENSRLSTPQSDYALAHAEDFGLTKEEMEGTVIKAPTVTFKNDLRIDLGNVAVELSYPGATHTNGSIIVYVIDDQVLFTGDILFTKYHPFIAEGDITSWIKILYDLEKSHIRLIVPGHGPVSAAKDLRDMAVYLKEFDTRAKKLCRGKTLSDAPAIAEELLKELPDQGRTEIPYMVESNLRAKYLLPASSNKAGKK